jgi:hypothetical protein
MTKGVGDARRPATCQRPRYREIDLQIQRLRLGLQVARPGWQWEIAANWAEIAVGKPTTLRFSVEQHGNQIAAHVPLHCILDEPLATTLTSILVQIDELT